MTMSHDNSLSRIGDVVAIPTAAVEKTKQDATTPSEIENHHQMGGSVAAAGSYNP
ncbi:hypothetical protein A2U01_0088572, partial [Trifolium medium]|nr:hypothetical protein [Trifolium medium]